MKEKNGNDLSDRKIYEPAELLCKQIELLAKESESADSEMLVDMSNAMANLYKALNS